MRVLSSRTFPLAPVKAAFRLMSQTNPRAQREILRAVLANNPSFALLNAWSELEYQVSKKVRMDRQNSPNQQIIKEVSKTLRLPKKSVTRLHPFLRSETASPMPSKAGTLPHGAMSSS